MYTKEPVSKLNLSHFSFHFLLLGTFLGMANLRHYQYFSVPVPAQHKVKRRR